jgi:hypothetical protein
MHFPPTQLVLPLRILDTVIKCIHISLNCLKKNLSLNSDSSNKSSSVCVWANRLYLLVGVCIYCWARQTRTIEGLFCFHKNMYIVFPRLCRIKDEQSVSFVVVVFRDQFDMGFWIAITYFYQDLDLQGSRSNRKRIFVWCYCSRG